MNKIIPSTLLLIASTFAAACAMNEGQPATVPAVGDPAMDPVTVVAVDTPTKATTATDSAKPPAITVPAVPGRNKRDSLALVSAIRAG